MARLAAEKMQVTEIATKQIFPPKFQARNKIEQDSLNDLVESIKKNGLINPITVKGVKGGFEIIAGHRRFLALKKMGWKEMPCIVRVEGRERNELVKFAENMKRSDLSDIEEAQSIKHIMQVGKMTEKDVSKMINRSVDYVKQKLAVLNYSDKLYAALFEGKISFSAARELARIDDEDVLKEYVRHAVISGITPGIAKTWADDFLSLKNANKKEYAEQESVRAGGQVESVKLPCHICDNYVTAQDSIMVRVCKDCRAELKI